MLSTILLEGALAVDAVGWPSQRDVALDGGGGLARQHVADLLVGVRGAELPEVLTRASLGEERAQEPLDRSGHLGGGHTIADGTRYSRVGADRAAHAEVVGVHQPPVDLQLLALEAEIGDPVLAATIGAAGDVDLQVLLESRQPRLEIGHESSGEALGLRQRDLAELRPRAGDGAAPERRGVDAKPERLELPREILGQAPRHVEDEEVLHTRGAQVPSAVALGQLRHRAKLRRGEPAPQHGDADVGKARLLLGVYTHMVAIHVFRRCFRCARGEALPQARLELGKEARLRPSVMQEEELEPGLLATLPEHIAVAKDFCDTLHHGGRLMPRYGRVESPPPTRTEKPSCPVSGCRSAVSPTSLISGYEHHTRQPVIDTLNLRGRL